MKNLFGYLEKANSIKNKETNYNLSVHEKLIKSIIKLFDDFNFQKIKKKNQKIRWFLYVECQDLVQL